MATTIYPTVPVAQPEAEQWSPNDIGDDDPICIQADEMFARVSLRTSIGQTGPNGPRADCAFERGTSRDRYRGRPCCSA